MNGPTDFFELKSSQVFSFVSKQHHISTRGKHVENRHLIRFEKMIVASGPQFEGQIPFVFMEPTQVKKVTGFNIVSDGVGLVRAQATLTGHRCLLVKRIH